MGDRVQVLVRIPRELHEALTDAARGAGVSLNDLVCSVLRKFLEPEPQKGGRRG